jgi:hypothetical protein
MPKKKKKNFFAKSLVQASFSPIICTCFVHTYKIKKEKRNARRTILL